MVPNFLRMCPSSLLIAAYIAIIASALQACTASDLKIKCTNIDEFFYATPGSHCTSYYKCSRRGQKEVSECGPGSMFDFYTQTCTRNSGVCFEPICTGRTNGVYQDTTHACRRSFTCHSGKVVSIDNCPSAHLHNGQSCVSQDLVMCDLPYTTAIGYPFSGDHRCSGRADGSYNAEDCSSYIVCRNQEVVDVRNCPEEQLFKDEAQQCTLARDVPFCPSNSGMMQHACRHKRDGSHFDPSSYDCKSFLVCKGESLISRELCASGSVFNGEYCVPDPVYTCPSSVWDSENDICKGRENGFFGNPQESCSSYVRCMSERTVELFDCPNEQYFDLDEKSCVFEKLSSKKKCLQPVRSQDCENKAKGFYQGQDCKIYYYCTNGYKTEYKCPARKVFDGTNCVPKEAYKCPLHNSCLSKEDGYYPDREGGCRSYYYCSNGHKITYLCEVGHIFDGYQCALATEGYQCNCDSICEGKSDGYHVDISSNCRDYIFCKNGEKITQLTCRGSNIFNGEKCVSPSLHTCPSNYNHKELNCMPKKCTKDCISDGFFPDIDSGCRNYFFCIGGKRSALSCTAGQIFNGEICVPEDKFNCPIFCDESVDIPLHGCSLNGRFT